MVKKFIWRLHGIPVGTPEDAVVDYFEPSERHRLRVKTLCPDVDDPESNLTATIEFDPPTGKPDAPPTIRNDLSYYLPLERDFMGFTPLYHPPAGAYDADIIAITGLAGHAIGSWTLPDGKMWLRDFLPHDAPTARILTYGYDARVQGRDLPTSTLGELAEEFLDSLITMRDCTPQGDQRPIILIGHSLGCLLIKKAMTSANYLRNGSRLPIRLIVFLAAPHRGMEIEALLTVIKDKPPQQLIHELGRNSPILKELNRLFIEASEQIQILSAFETLETATVEFDEATGKCVRSGKAIVLVTSDSAIENLKNEQTILAKANHSTIAKLDKHQGSIYPRLRFAIRQSLLPTAQVKAVHDKSNKQNLVGAKNVEKSQTASTRDHYSTARKDSTNADVIEHDDYDLNQKHDEGYQQSLVQNDDLGDYRAPPRGDASSSGSTFHGTTIEAAGSFSKFDHDLSSQLQNSHLAEDSDGKMYDAEVPTVHSSSNSRTQSSKNHGPAWPCTSCKLMVYFPDFIYSCYKSANGEHTEIRLDLCENCYQANKICPQHGMALARYEMFFGGKITMFRIFVDPSIRPHDTALVKAIKSRDIGLVERLAGVAGLKGLVDENGNSALHVAAHLGLRYEAECLMINGANIEAENKLGHTPLVQAIRAKQLTLVNLLLEYGANKNAVNHGGRTTLQGACQMQCTDIIVALLAFTDSVQLEEFVNRRADNGRTALSFMSPTGAIEIIKLLLDAGASPEIEDQNGNSSLSWAAFWGQTETVKLFLDSGASKNPPSRISKWKKNGFQTSVSEKTRVEILALLETPESSRFKWKWGRSK